MGKKPVKKPVKRVVTSKPPPVIIVPPTPLIPIKSQHEIINENITQIDNVNNIANNIEQTNMNKVNADSFRTNKYIDTYDNIIRTYDRNWDNTIIPNVILTTIENQCAIISKMAYSSSRLYKIKRYTLTSIDNKTHINELEKSLVYDESISNDRCAVYYYKYNHKYAIIGYRGTDITNMDDIITNLNILIGNANIEYVKNALDIYNIATKKYDSIIVCGHSLGGYVANAVAMYKGCLSYSFNPAWMVSVDYYNSLNKYPNINCLKIHDDIISLYAGLQNINNLKVFKPHPIIDNDRNNILLFNHSIDNFIIPKQKNSCTIL